jgi:hypothetical protein
VRLEGELAAPGLEERHRAALEERKRVQWAIHRDGLIGWERRFALARIQAKIARLNPNHTFLEMLRAFGRPTQREPTLSEARLLAFEAEYRVTLPEEYRLFLREVGNGGLGPGTGMPRISDAVDRSPLLDLATPFPFSLRQYREDPERFSQEQSRETSGEDRGMVWGYRPINCGWTPECPTTEEDNRWEHGALRGFFRWYKDWLDTLLTPQNRPESSVRGIERDDEANRGDRGHSARPVASRPTQATTEALFSEFFHFSCIQCATGRL